MLSLKKYAGVEEIDLEKKEVRVRGGTKLIDLERVLEKSGLCLEIGGAVNWQTVAGAISTATHGSSAYLSSISSLLLSLRVIDGRGQILEIGHQNRFAMLLFLFKNSQISRKRTLFNSVAVSVGMMGVITKMTLKCREMFYVEETTGKALDAEIFTKSQNLQNLFVENRYAQLTLFPEEKKLVCMSYNETKKKPEELIAQEWKREKTESKVRVQTKH